MRNSILYISVLIIICAILVQGCNEQDITYQNYFVNGKDLYEKNCQSCHGLKGEGLGKLYPPLTDTVYLSDNRSKLACIIKNGLSGTIEVNNVSYETEMPGNKDLADID